MPKKTMLEMLMPVKAGSKQSAAKANTADGTDGSVIAIGS